MEKVTVENIQRYIVLNDELSIEDPYVLKITEKEFLEKHMKDLISERIEIFILQDKNNDIGFAEINVEDDNAFIEKIYIRKLYCNVDSYKSILNFIDKYYKDSNVKKVMYIGVNDRSDLIKSFEGFGYSMDKEHIQMEKPLLELKKDNLLLQSKTFFEIGDSKWIFNFMKECMNGSVFNYDQDEVTELTKAISDLNLVLFEDNAPIGFIVSDINEQRNLQEDKKVIYIEQIAILKLYRNKGWGHKILKSIMNYGFEKGMEIARLHVYRNNENAYKLYKGIGFIEIKSIGYWCKNLSLKE